MSMSARNYKMVAGVFAESMRGMNLNYREKMLMFHLAARLAEVFRDDNPNFSKTLFLEACKVEHVE